MRNFIVNKGNSVFVEKIFAGFLLLALLMTGVFIIPVNSQIIEDKEIFEITKDIVNDELVSSTIVISQFQAGGGVAEDEFIELHNVGTSNFDLSGYRLVYRSASGVNDVALVNWTSSTTIPPGGYHLIASTSYDGGVTPNSTYNPASCSCSISATGGGLAIRNGALNTGTIIDAVGWGTATNIFIEGTKTTAPANNNSQVRKTNGCQDTDNNVNDFESLIPAAARNSSTAVNICGGGGTGNMSAVGAASPSSVLPGGTTKLTVTVTPATSPAGTGITVTGDLTSIGGSATQTFFDDGTNGDTTIGDNIFTYNATVAAGTSTGTKSLPVNVADAQSRTATTSISLTVGTTGGGGHTPEEHLVMGNPCNAVTDVNQPTNYLLSKLEYAVSYHRDRGIPNWVSWHLDSTWLGSTPRQDNFRPDQTLPAGWYQVTDSSYSSSGFTRGHHTPSGDRTSSVSDNSATFLMTNMMPQAANNNNDTWADLENYSRTLVTAGNELYIIAGGSGTGGDGTNGFATTIDSGRVTVPAKTWKIIVVLPIGDNDAARVTNSTRVIAVIMPNSQTINTNWGTYIATVDQIEAMTGCDYLSNVDVNAQNAIESKIDPTFNTAPSVSARTLTTAEDTSANITFTGTDPNVNNVLDFSIVSQPANGTVTVAPGVAPSASAFTYTPNPNFFGTDTFTYKANDSVADSNTATVTVTVTSVNDAPGVVSDSKSTSKNISLSFPASDLTVNDNTGAANESGQTLTVSRVITTAQTNGTVSLVGGQITYVPTNEFTGSASFDYEVCDNGTTNGNSDPKCSIGTVNVNVLAPSAASTTVSGRVVTLKGRGISGVTVTLTNSNGFIVRARTNVFGFYRLTNIPAGETYVVNAVHKLYRFTPQAVTLTDELTNLTLTADR